MERPVRADRSRTLIGERGGRLDRFDVWFLVVLLLATFGMRTFRLAEPYEMHFDEVYHARTATEFLQAWRYGDSHEIYEWTHPHLAKYAMAAGLVLWGEDHVSGTGDLGTPVVAAAIEQRREDPLTGERAGERVHLATGDVIRSEDLRTRRTVSSVEAPGSSALAIDEPADQLVIGFDDGRIATVDLSILGLDGVDSGVEPIALATVDHPVTHRPRVRRRRHDRRRLGRPPERRRCRQRRHPGHARPAGHRRPGHGRDRVDARRHAGRHRRPDRRRLGARRDPRDRCRRLRGPPR